MTHYLESSVLKLEVLPEIGGAITTCSFQGVQVFARPANATVKPTYLGNEKEWVRAWNGGWQLAIPNAGKEHLASLKPQGFHGNASQEKWELLKISTSDAEMLWEKEGLSIRRRISVTNNQLEIYTEVTNLESTDRTFIATEHLVLGDEFLVDPIVIDPDSDSEFVELDYVGNQSPTGWVSWGLTTWELLKLSDPARMGVLATSQISVHNPSIRINIDWDRKIFPYIWLWEEFGASHNEPWNGNTYALGIEPAVTSDGLGLGEAERLGNTLLLAQSKSLSWNMTLTFENIL
jgi:hypothetical protein